MTDRPPMLLALADYYGTLAAARCLGRQNIPVTMAESRLLAAARWSNYITRRVECPDLTSPDPFMEWLLDFGEHNPGHVLYPTSDDLCWLYSRHREVLSRNFRLYQPAFGAIFSLLDKANLNAACAAVGQAVPQTWLPTSHAEVAQVASEVEFPVLIKPRTQMLFYSRHKGLLVNRRSELVPRYFEFMKGNRFGVQLVTHDPTIVWPMVQAFHPEARQSIYSLSGFIDHSGELFVARAARKVLQRPRRLGIGLCFEDTVLSSAISEKVAALCRHVGYHGVFEVELIEVADRMLLIDFNPRFYGQMAFEVARHLPLPLLVYQAALGNTEVVRTEVQRAQAWAPDGKHIYAHRILLGFMLWAQQLAGGVSEREAQGWRQWLTTHRARATDAVADESDRLPSVVDLAFHLTHYTRHPRAFVRSVAREPQ